MNSPLYQIETGIPRRDMSGFGFNIKLWPEWRELVSLNYIDQSKANKVIKSLGGSWLVACGYEGFFDPDNCGFQKDPNKKPGPNSSPMYKPEFVLRVAWGEWGPEHITVPGNACGLDIGSAIGGPRNGRVLEPHNVDTIRQAYLLQLIFNWFANAMVLDYEVEQIPK